MSPKPTSPKSPSRGKQERYIQPSILMRLYVRASYGYELIQNIQKFGFVQGDAPPGMIYRHLRQLEEDGLVRSEWETKESGPAKRVYQITDDGKEILAIWVDYMEGQADKLNSFVKQFKKALRKKGSA
ncbi:MAG: helix-turn-helix transcriptional regulator [Deltaproteobacteria bacterium]|nr:helix-turn-helix transcriptional regulator [Deltaproteobacteria bacterium]